MRNHILGYISGVNEQDVQNFNKVAQVRAFQNSKNISSGLNGFSTHKYTLTGDFLLLGLNRITPYYITSGETSVIALMMIT